MIKIGAWSICLCVFAFRWASGVAAADLADPLTLEAIFSPDSAKRIEFGGTPITDLEWTTDGSAYLQPQGQGKSFEPPLRVELDVDRSRPLFDPSKLIESLSELEEFPPADARNLLADDVRLSPLQDALLIQRANDLYHFSIGDSTAKRLTHSESPKKSPDSAPTATGWPSSAITSSMSCGSTTVPKPS